MRPINDLEKMFYDELRDKLTTTKYYTDAVLLRHAYRFIPFEELKVKGTLRLSLLEEEDEFEVSLEDCILLELLHWFKNDFFTWFDAPKCQSCNVTAENRGTRQPTPEEAMSSARRVEYFVCPKCQATFRFPRYNDPKKLLQTRTGRCGEWANCFALLCHALEYDTRLVVDWTDHVWVEIFSQTRHKWMHCDPCENICDKPLMYEIGWKKKLSYVIAFSPTEIQDVTWRYTANFEDVLSRRGHCREEFLLYCIQSFQAELEKRLDEDEKATLRYRRLMELADMLTPAMLDEASYEGRSSGSLAWRLARGEIDNSPKSNEYIFQLTPEEIEAKRFNLKYSCSEDKYVRGNSQLSESHNWASRMYAHSCVFRKVESDWKMAYLARTEGSHRGVVSWKFDFEKCDLVVNELRIFLHTETFQNGKVTWILLPNSDVNNPKVYSADSVRQLYTGELKGCSSFVLSAEMTDGSGENAWQHSQLFRQSLDSKGFPFELEVTFKKKYFRL